jgi:hypothetical protein
MTTKRGEAALVRMIEEGVAELGQLPTQRFSFLVTSAEAVGSPPRLVRASATLFFLKSGGPFCCGEPGCYSELFIRPGEVLGDYLRTRMSLRQSVGVELKVTTVYDKGIVFAAIR